MQNLVPTSHLLITYGYVKLIFFKSPSETKGYFTLTLLAFIIALMLLSNFGFTSASGSVATAHDSFNRHASVIPYEEIELICSDHYKTPYKC